MTKRLCDECLSGNHEHLDNLDKKRHYDNKSDFMESIDCKNTWVALDGYTDQCTCSQIIWRLSSYDK